MVTSLRGRDAAPSTVDARSGAVHNSLPRKLQELGLQGYEARVLLALLHAGPADSAQLAELSGVPRTSIYRVMEALTDQGLAEQVLTHGPTVWACDGWETVLDMLDAAEEERLRQHHLRTHQLRQALAEVLPSTPKA